MHRMGQAGEGDRGRLHEAKSSGPSARRTAASRARRTSRQRAASSAPPPLQVQLSRTKQPSRTKVHLVAHTRTPHSPLLRRNMQLGHSRVPAPSGWAVLAWSGRAVNLWDEHDAPPGRHPAKTPCSAAGEFIYNRAGADHHHLAAEMLLAAPPYECSADSCFIVAFPPNVASSCWLPAGD